MKENKHRKNSFIWSISDEEFKTILNNNKGFEKIGLALGFKNKPGSASRKEIRARAAELNIKLPEYNPNLKAKKLPAQNIKKETTVTPVCKKCGIKIRNDSKSGLCISCYKENINSEKIKHWKETGDTGCAVQTTLRNSIRNYIFEKQNKKCAICGIESFWNEKELHFILDHIDRNAANNFENNLRLICPNCDSQLNTYKSRNKNSARSNKRHN